MRVDLDAFELDALITYLEGNEDWIDWWDGFGSGEESLVVQKLKRAYKRELKACIKDMRERDFQEYIKSLSDNRRGDISSLSSTLSVIKNQLAKQTQ